MNPAACLSASTPSVRVFSVPKQDMYTLAVLVSFATFTSVTESSVVTRGSLMVPRIIKVPISSRIFAAILRVLMSDINDLLRSNGTTQGSWQFLSFHKPQIGLQL